MSAIIPSSLTGGFLSNIATSPIVTGLTGTRTVTGTPTIQATLSESFLQARAILDNILSGGELPETFRQATVTRNLLGLGEAAVDISGALSEQVAIREEQRARDQEALRNTQLQLESINERLSRQVTELGESLKTGAAGFDLIKFFTDNPLIGGIGIGGLAVGAVVLLLVLRR